MGESRRAGNKTNGKKEREWTCGRAKEGRKAQERKKGRRERTKERRREEKQIEERRKERKWGSNGGQEINKRKEGNTADRTNDEVRRSVLETAWPTVASTQTLNEDTITEAAMTQAAKRRRIQSGSDPNAPNPPPIAPTPENNNRIYVSI